MTVGTGAPRRRGLAERHIVRLARLHGVKAERLPLDMMADDFARLSDAEMAPDPVDDLVVTLMRKGILGHDEAMALLAAYAAETPSRA